MCDLNMIAPGAGAAAFNYRPYRPLRRPYLVVAAAAFPFKTCVCNALNTCRPPTTRDSKFKLAHPEITGRPRPKQLSAPDGGASCENRPVDFSLIRPMGNNAIWILRFVASSRNNRNIQQNLKFWAVEFQVSNVDEFVSIYFISTSQSKGSFLTENNRNVASLNFARMFFCILISQ